MALKSDAPPCTPHMEVAPPGGPITNGAKSYGTHGERNSATLITCFISVQCTKMSQTCQKLMFTHRIVVLKSGLENNWMQKLDHVNQP